MKYLYLSIFFIFSFNCFEAQTRGNIIYRIVSEEIKSNEGYSQSKKKFVSLLNSMSPLRDSLFFNLDFNNKKSRFYLDRKKNIGISNEKGYNAILRSFGATYFRDDENELLIEEINSDDLYLITSITNVFKWETSKETKKIGSYVCYKALTKLKSKSVTKGDYIRIIEAWYCPDIAINLGPKNYGGLPGLIFELKEGKLTYYIYSINFDINPTVKMPDKGKKITREEYNNMLPHITNDNFNEYIGG